MFHTPTNDAKGARLDALLRDYQQSIERAESSYNKERQRIWSQFTKQLYLLNQNQTQCPSLPTSNLALNQTMAGSASSGTLSLSQFHSHSNANSNINSNGTSSKHSSATPPLVSQRPPNLVGAASLANGPGPNGTSSRMANSNANGHGAAGTKTANALHPLHASNAQKLQMPQHAMNGGHGINIGANTKMKQESESEGEFVSQSTTMPTKTKSKVRSVAGSSPQSNTKTERGRPKRNRLQDEHQCQIDSCNKSYTTKGNLNRHLKDHHKLNPDLTPIYSTSSSSGQGHSAESSNPAMLRRSSRIPLRSSSKQATVSPSTMSLQNSSPGSVHLAGTVNSGPGGNHMVNCDECTLSFVDLPALKKHKASRHKRPKEYICVHTECREHEGFLSVNGCKEHGRRNHDLKDAEVSGYVAKCKQAALDAQFQRRNTAANNGNNTNTNSNRSPSGSRSGSLPPALAANGNVHDATKSKNHSGALRANAFNENGNIGVAKMAGVADGRRLNFGKPNLFPSVQQPLLQSTMPNFPQVLSNTNSTNGTSDSSSPSRGTPSLPTQSLHLPHMFGSNFANNGNQNVVNGTVPNKLTPPFAMLGGATTPNIATANVAPTALPNNASAAARGQGLSALMQLMAKQHGKINPLHVAATVLKLQKQGHVIPPQKMAELRMVINHMMHRQAAMHPNNGSNGNLLRAMLTNNGMMQSPLTTPNGVISNVNPLGLPSPVINPGTQVAFAQNISSGPPPGTTPLEMPPLVAGSSASTSSSDDSGSDHEEKDSNTASNGKGNGNGIGIGNGMQKGKDTTMTAKTKIERSSSHGFGGINALLQAAEAMDGKSYSRDSGTSSTSTSTSSSHHLNSSSESRDSATESDSDSDSDASQRSRSRKMRPQRSTQSKKRSYAESQDNDADPDYKPPRQATKRKKIYERTPEDDPRLEADVLSGVCSICKRTKGKKMSSSSWMTHLRSSHRYPCLKKCGFRFTTQQFLTIHMAKAHPEE